MVLCSWRRWQTSDAIGQVRSGCCTSMLHTLAHSLQRSLGASGWEGGFTDPGHNALTWANVKESRRLGTHWT
jgi:hypothetical protein